MIVGIMSIKTMALLDLLKELLGNDKRF